MSPDAALEDPGSLIARELGAGERLLWCGRPRQGVFLRANDAVMIPFSLMWGGFAIFWETMALSAYWGSKTDRTPKAILLIFPLWGIPFVAVGLYMMVGRFFVDKALRERTVYAVTNQRAIIRSGLFRPVLKSLSLRTLADLSLTEEKEGRGTITFGATSPLQLGFAGGSRQAAAPCFESIADARRVYEIIRTAQAEAR